MDEFGNCVLEGLRSLDNCYVCSQWHIYQISNVSDVGVILRCSNNSRTHCIYDIMTQTTMEYANIVIDGFNDFANFCKEEEIISFTNKAVKECGLNQNVTMLVENVETTYDNVTTSLVQKHIVNMV